MHILFVLEHYYPYIGGAEKLFKDLAESMTKQGFEVTVLTTRHNHTIPKHEILNKVNIVRLPFKNRFLFTFFSLPYLIKHIRKADIVHTTSYNAAFPAFFAAKYCRKPVYITFHEVWDRLWFTLPFYSLISKTAFYLFEKMILLLPFDKYIAVSNYTKSCLLDVGIKKSKIVMIYNGMDYERIEHYRSSLIRQKQLFTYYGRLGASKGIELLLEAIFELKKETSLFKCQLIIPQYPHAVYVAVMDLISTYKINDQLDIYHELKVDALYQTIQKGSFVVIPSYSEGFCFVAAECAALNIPVVSSGRGALKETVSGKYIELEHLDANQLKISLKKGLLGQWQEREPTQFLMRDMIDSYVQLYQ